MGTGLSNIPNLLQLQLHLLCSRHTPALGFKDFSLNDKFQAQIIIQAEFRQRENRLED